MKVILHPDGQLMLKEGVELTYAAEKVEADVDCPTTYPPPPPGFVSATYDSETGLCVGYDAFGNATPGIDWPAARRVLAAAPVLKQGKSSRAAAREGKIKGQKL